MRIERCILRMRKGSLSLETALLLPFLLMGTLVSTYITAHVLHRGEVVTQARNAAVSAAFNRACQPHLSGDLNFDGFDETTNVACRLVDGEKGLTSVLPFWEAARQAARAWPDITKDLQPDEVQDVIALGYGQSQFTAPPFLKNLSDVAAQEIHRLPVADLWTHHEGSFRAGYDPVLFSELQKRGTYRLFPEVFPAAGLQAQQPVAGLAELNPQYVQAALLNGTNALITLNVLNPQDSNLSTFGDGAPLLPGGSLTIPGTLNDEQIELLTEILVNAPASGGDIFNDALKNTACQAIAADMRLALLGVRDLPNLGSKVEMSPAAFEDYFTEKTGGLKLDDTISWYKAATGKDLSKDTVQTLFTDPLGSTRILMEDESLHTVYRSILNAKVPSVEPDENSTQWEKLPLEKSLFHGVFNSKWVSIPDGHREAIYDGNGNLVKDNVYKGTFNFFGPHLATEHTYADVLPYCKWGN